MECLNVAIQSHIWREKCDSVVGMLKPTSVFYYTELGLQVISESFNFWSITRMWLAHLSIMKSGIIIGLVMPRSAKAL